MLKSRPYLVPIALLALAFAVIGWSVVSAVSFDHSVCQYPYRLSNPIAGCDNSDPAQPECMTDGKEVCIPVLKEIVSPAASQTVETVQTPIISEPVYESYSVK